MDGRLILLKWIERRTTQAEFARKIGVSQSHLSLVLSGKRGVSLRTSKRIHSETGGTVPMGALVMDREPPKARRAAG